MSNVPLIDRAVPAASESNRVVTCFEYCFGRQNERQGRSKQAVKVEPKLYFANERTLLSWMNVCVLLATLSLTLLNFGAKVSVLPGLILFAVSICFTVYAFYVYYRRLHAITDRDAYKNFQYYDVMGPTILVCVFIFALVSLLLIFLYQVDMSSGIHPVKVKPEKSVNGTTTARNSTLPAGDLISNGTTASEIDSVHPALAELTFLKPASRL